MVANMANLMRVEPDLTQRLLRALEEPIDSSAERDEILTALLAQLGAERFVRVAMDASDPYSRANFARGLALIGPRLETNAISYLLKLSRSPDPDVSWAADDALASLPMSCAVRERMVQLAQDSDADRRRLGEQALAAH